MHELRVTGRHHIYLQSSGFDDRVLPGQVGGDYATEGAKSVGPQQAAKAVKWLIAQLQVSFSARKLTNVTVILIISETRTRTRCE